MRKQYTVYKTVNKVNGKFYIGVHQTDDPHDEYLGSGKLIKQAVQKYGEQNFRKEVLAIFENSKEAYMLERKLVAEVLGTSPCYNLKSGGEGGFDYLNSSGIGDLARSLAGNRLKEMRREDPRLMKKFQGIARNNLLIYQKSEGCRRMARTTIKRATVAAAVSNRKTAKQEEAIELRKLGWSVKKIAARLEVASSSVCSWVRHVGLTDEQKQRLTSRPKPTGKEQWWAS